MASSASSPASGVVAYVIVANADVLECGVCFLPLKPPIFQCAVGHVVCSPCRDKLKDARSRKCHVCGVAMANGYRRCHAMERLVESLLVPCPHAAYGCAAMPAYHARDEHLRACAQAPCRCPSVACGFIGSMAALLDHIARAHGWLCTANALDRSRWFYLDLVDGFNFVIADADGPAANGYLILLNVAQPSFGRAVSVLCIHPRAGGPSEAINCILEYRREGNEMISHYLESCEMRVACTDLSMGCPIQTTATSSLPKFVHGDDDEAVRVTVSLFTVENKSKLT